MTSSPSTRYGSRNSQKHTEEVTDIGFVCNAHARIFDEETASYLKNAGCRIVKFGLESGSDRIRRAVLHRYMSNKHIEEAFDIAHRFGFHTSAFVMMGLPHETIADIQDTVRLLARSSREGSGGLFSFLLWVQRHTKLRKNQDRSILKRCSRLDNFTDETCMVLGDDIDLYVDKVKTFLCAFVNGYADIDGEQQYLELVKQLNHLIKRHGIKRRKRFVKEVDELDKIMEEKGKLHYTVKYNPFMGVRSDWKDDSISA